MDFLDWDENKSLLLKQTRGLSLLEASELLTTDNYVLLRKNDDPEQWLAIGFTCGRLISLVYEERYNDNVEYTRLITYWDSTKREKEIYEKKNKYK